MRPPPTIAAAAMVVTASFREILEARALEETVVALFDGGGARLESKLDVDPVPLGKNAWEHGAEKTKPTARKSLRILSPITAEEVERFTLYT